LISATSTITSAATITGGNLATGGTTSATGTVTGGNIATGGTVSSTGTATLGNVNTGGLISATGTVTGGNLATGGTVSATGNATVGNISATNHTGTTVSVTGSITAGGDLSITGNIVDGGAMTIITSSNGNITLSPNGTGVIIVNKDILNGQGNGVGNIGNATGYFNTIFAKATSAQYADLAEKYEADAEYAPGTVLAFGGDKEVTLSTEAGSTRVAGVVSTNPSYIMNAGLTAEHVAMVALQGRVPCRVVGPVAKGDMMVSAGNGAARVDNSARAGSIIGKALENFDGATGTIEVVIGRN